MQISFSPKGLFLKLFGVILVLLGANIISVLFNFHYIHPEIDEPQMTFASKGIRFLVNLFDFNAEGNVPSFFSSLLLILCAYLLLFIGKSEKFNHKRYIGWYGLGVVFLFLSIDEMTSIHERFMMTTRNILNVSGLFFFAWVIPYGIALLVLLGVYLKFLIRLPRETAKLFVMSGIVYVGGALIIEMPEGLVVEKYGYYDPLFYILYTCEEFLEMLGLIIFIYALTSFRTFTLKIT